MITNETIHLCPASISRGNLFWQAFRKKRKRMSRTPAIPLQIGARLWGKIEVLPNAIHTIAVQAISECYGVVGITAPRLHYGQPVMLGPEHLNQGVQVRIINEQIVLDVYVALEYGLRISEIAHNIADAVCTVLASTWW